ncbi:hypothetical protein OG618_00335 [Kitasatospora sp. NBC_01246]|uniref:hypothetical protein n=1 Tax=Kitasatospora sp. NBC_01246 TaxID=2903570 RepID=UPI002E3428B6|nr:hypothetical protein [Kitasatospora sp. NBC_01246]
MTGHERSHAVRLSTADRALVALGAPTGAAPAASARRTGIPGLASWEQRATAAGIEVGIAGGLMTAYLAGLSALAPAFAALQVLALLADTDIRGALAGVYRVVWGRWLVLQWAERVELAMSVIKVRRGRAVASSCA